MSDELLRQAVKTYVVRYGSSISFVASKVGVSREHFSRWLNNNGYTISSELETKIKLFLNGKG